MHVVKPIVISLPDGSERELRFTLGARKRIQEIFGMDLKAALEKHQDGALPRILFALMHDADGNPPAVSINWLEENLPADSAVEVMAAIVSAAGQGKVSKKEIEDLMQMRIGMSGSPTGSTTGLSVPKSSESATEISGGDTSNVKLAPGSAATTDSSDPIESLPAQ